MKRALAGLLAGLLVLSLTACHTQKEQTKQPEKPALEETVVAETKPEETDLAETQPEAEAPEETDAAESAPEQETSAVGLSEIFSSEAGEVTAAELDSDARAYFFDFAERWRLDRMPVTTDNVWPEKMNEYLEWLLLTQPREERTGRMPVREAMERVMAEFYGVPTLSNSDISDMWTIEDNAFVSKFMDESEYQVRLPEKILWQTGALGTYYTLTLAPGDWEEGYRELRERYVQEAEIREDSARRVYVSFLFDDDGAPVFTNKVRAEAGEAPDYVIAPEFEPGLSRMPQDAAWFRAREAAQEWPGLTWNGTSIYDLELDALRAVYGEPEQISHEPFIQEEYYDVVEFPDGSQAGGICSADGGLTRPNAAYLRLIEGTDVCGVTAGEDYREAANRFPREGLPVIYRLDEHMTLLLLGGEVRYMGKYSLIEYTDGEPTTLMICDETAMRFRIDDGKITAVSYHAPEEAKQLPLSES